SFLTILPPPPPPYTLSLHDALPIWLALREGVAQYYMTLPVRTSGLVVAYIISGGLGGVVYSSTLLIIALIAAQTIGTTIIQPQRSEEHTSELQSRFDLVCRLLLEKK